MLTHLHIENYVIIERLELDLAVGLNTITGETGAGKSILLGALSLLGGAKADAGVVGVNGDSCVVEGTFRIGGYGLEGLLSELDVECGAEIDIRRVVSKSGKSRAFIDDTPVAIGSLRAIVDRLIDIHSQHQTLLLGREEFQREIVDAIAVNGALMSDYQALYTQLQADIKSLKALKASQTDNSARADYLAFQIEELTGANVEVGEQSELEQELRELTHAEDIGVALSTVSAAMQDDDAGALQAIKSALRELRGVENNFSHASELTERLDSLYIELKDIASEVDSHLDNVEVNPRRLEVVQDRIDTIYTLCQKHKVDSGDELADVLTGFEAELDLMDNSADNIERLEAQIETLSAQALQKAQKLTLSRQKVAPGIEKHIVESLKKLGIKTPRFEVSLTACELNSCGADTIKFRFSANDGAAMQNIESAASGGEMSRLMLSIKALVARQLKLPTVIFDEIDTGVSGAIADAMGDIIYSLAGSMQIINITHLPQVASKGEHHFQVYKDKGTHIRKLSGGERVEQIASMISGSVVTDAAREQAMVLLEIKK